MESLYSLSLSSLLSSTSKAICNLSNLSPRKSIILSVFQYDFSTYLTCFTQFLRIFDETSALNISKTFTSGIKLVHHTPDHSQVELIQLVPVRPNFARRFNSMFDNPRNRCSQCSSSFGIQCYDCIFIKRIILSIKVIVNI